MFTTTTSFPGAGGGGGGGAVSGGRFEQPVSSVHPYPVYHVGGVGGVGGIEHMGGSLMYPYHPLYPPVGGMGGLGGLGGVGAMGGGIGAMGLQHQVDTSRKRAREPDHGAGEHRAAEHDESGASSSKRRAGSQDVLFRMVVPSKHIGKVIGKEGSRIRQIREETGATIKIADPIVPHEERVIIISSAADEGKVSPAETALYAIAKAILKENDDASEVSGAGTGHTVANAIRLLIAGSQAGCLIGVSGQTIEQIRNSSGAAMAILAPNQLPLCASAHESDRVVQLSGDVPEILKALEKIGSMLRENPSTKVISVRTSYNPSMPGSNPSNFQVPPADYVTSEMTIMEKFVGGLIGRNGYNISRIRNVSGATIKVTGQKGENTRQIFFGGSSQQVAVARMLVENYMYSQFMPQNVL